MIASRALSCLLAFLPAPTLSAPVDVQTVIILDFTNRSVTGGENLARLATDGVAVELAASGKFEVLRRAEVERTAKELNLSPPYDAMAQSKLASELGASAIVDGSIDYVNERIKNGIRTIVVALKVHVRETSSGELINGAAVIGESSGPLSEDRTANTYKAGAITVELVVRRILAHKLVEGVVISTHGLLPKGVDALLNVGEKQGVRTGMEMMVLRDGKKVGTVKVVGVWPTDSELKITQVGSGIRPEDRVREVFDEPHYQTRDELIDPNKRKK